jgi:hypothetical protein
MANRLNAGTTPDMSAAMDAVGKAVTPQEPQGEEDDKKRYVNIRFKSAEYKKIGHIATEAGVTNTAFCKMAAVYMADMVKSGAFSVNAGGFISLRRG